MAFTLSVFIKYSCCTLLLVHHLAKVAWAAGETNCHSATCRPIEEYCSQFEQTCLPCSRACDTKDIKYEPDACSRECSDFIKLQPLKNEIHHIQMQQNVILILLIVLLAITAGHFTWKLIKWLKQKRCFGQLVKKLKMRKEAAHPATLSNGKEFVGTTIPNLNAINDIERAPSQIYSLTGVEGSVRTVTTPISSRHPAENTTPSQSPQPNEYSYDNQGLVVTPVSEKPSSGPVFA